MVEPNGPNRTLPGTDEKIFMSGSQEDFEADMMKRLDGVDLNVLEQGLLKNYLKDRKNCCANVLNLLEKLELKHAADNY